MPDLPDKIEMNFMMCYRHVYPKVKSWASNYSRIFQVYGAISEDGKFIFIFICLIVESDLVDDDEIVNIGFGSRNL